VWEIADVGIPGDGFFLSLNEPVINMETRMSHTAYGPETRYIVLFLSILLVFFFPGCSGYVKYRYGIQQPKPETPGSLLGFLEKQGFPGDNQYLFTDTVTFLHWMNSPVLRQHLLSHLIFDKYGQWLPEDTAACQWAGGNFIAALHPDSSYAVRQDIRLEQITGGIRRMGICHCPADGENPPDFTIVVTWGKFLGKYNYRLFNLGKAVLENPTANIRLIWLNIDIQKDWKFPPGRKLQLK
jgi:hypothetical protein